MDIRAIAKTILPPSTYNSLRSARRLLKWRWARARGAVIDRSGLLAGLAKIGVRQNDILLVHSSLTSLGYVEGGPEAVIDALLDALASGGTLLMPAYPVTGDWMAYITSDPLYDPRQARSSMGKITDVFWRRPGVLRSLHPTHAVAAYGPQAEYLVHGHELSQSPCGPGSPFSKLVELRGRILHLGSPFCNTTSLHVVEDVLPEFPLQVYLPEAIPMRYLDGNGTEHRVPVKIHDPAVAATRLEKVPEKEQEIYRYCHDHGVVRAGKIGAATVHLIEAKPLEDLLEVLAAKGITIYA